MYKFIFVFSYQLSTFLNMREFSVQMEHLFLRVCVCAKERVRMCNLPLPFTLGSLNVGHKALRHSSENVWTAPHWLFNSLLSRSLTL